MNQRPNFKGGRGDRTRTCDSLVPNQERYQLRYTSFCGCKGTHFLRPLQTFPQFILDFT